VHLAGELGVEDDLDEALAWKNDAVAKGEGLSIGLVGNAATLGGLRPVGHFPPAEWERVLAVNLTANWRLIRSMDALLRASEAGRAIFVTSGVTRALPAYWGAYAASKAALEAMVRTYAAELAKTRVRVNLIDPGVVGTALRAEAMPGEDPTTLPPPEAVTEAFVALAEIACTRHGELVPAYPRERARGA
jgi:NAD(P)-dependent dehydrogenase (short-subunit alcohol dehydrogenase family)